MADIANKYAENVSGKFYVDDQCIDCDRPDGHWLVTTGSADKKR